MHPSERKTMISTLKIPRVAGTLMLALCGLAFHGAAQAIAMYDASASLSVKVALITGTVRNLRADQFKYYTVVEQGDGATTDMYTLTPGGDGGSTSLTPGANGTVVTNAASVMGSADTNGSLAFSGLETDIFLWFNGGPSGGTATLNYTFTGSANASIVGDKGFAIAVASFALSDDFSGTPYDSRTYTASSLLGPPGDGGVYPLLPPGVLTIPVPAGRTVALRIDVDAFGMAVPAPAPLALIAGGLLAIGASRRRAGAGQGL
jgi:hypothetical protein